MRKKKKFRLLLLVAVMCLTTALPVFAYSVYYSVGTAYIPYVAIDTYDTPVTLSVDTRPSTGTAGVEVRISDAMGIYTTQMFPYQVDRAPWVKVLGADDTYTISIRSREGTATGYLDYYATY